MMRHIFYVIEPDPVVRLDLSTALPSQFPECQVHFEDALSEALRPPDGAHSCVLVNGSLPLGDRKDDLSACASRGISIIFIGTPKESIPNAHVLETPFTNRMIFEAVTNAASVPPATRPEDHT